MKFIFIPLCIGIGMLMLACSQQKKPQKPNPVRRKSPIAIASISHKPTNTYVKIVYGEPYKKGRRVFGTLIPYGEVWRTGANEATELTTTKSLMFNGNILQAGTYGLFTIPGKKQWTIILNDSLGQWGAFDYKKKYDHLRTNVMVEKAKQATESFTIQFSDIKNDTSSIILRWDTTKVKIPIKFIRSHSD